jgi:von Hippel-Lindau disease tumor supressor
MRRVFLAAIVAALATSARAQTELQDVGCAGENSLRSTEEKKVTEVIFFNQSPAPIRTYWLDHQGQRIFGTEIRPGDSYVQQTFVTHPWVVTKSGAKTCVAIYQPEASSAIVVVH